MVKYYCLFKFHHQADLTLALCGYTQYVSGFINGTAEEFKRNIPRLKFEHEVKNNGNFADYWLEEEVPSWVLNKYSDWYR